MLESIAAISRLAKIAWSGLSAILPMIRRRQNDGAPARVNSGTAIDTQETALISGTTVAGNLTVENAQVLVNNFHFQATKRAENTKSVIEQASALLQDKNVSDAPIDHDWTSRFFSYVQDVSSVELQELWARVLAGVVERPEGVSIRTLSILRDLDQATAELFRRLCSCCMAIRDDEADFLDARVCSLGGRADQNSLKPYGLGFRELNRLNEYGLIIPGYNSVLRYEGGATDIHVDDGIHFWRIPIRFQNRFWYLIHKKGANTTAKIDIQGVALTIAGRELSEVVKLLTMPEYQEALNVYFRGMGLIMTETGDETGTRFKIQE